MLIIRTSKGHVDIRFSEFEYKGPPRKPHGARGMGRNQYFRMDTILDKGEH